ncbi:nitronate monooxygenase [Calidifontibacter sp. DB0510]|uniref:Propionate 3-nitronate monooxygenase n=1 Tax=Metallococcus carri TaxID=1656884 RepID=A0A967B4Z1_9MICO|nr:nitronate monooxygenase [Metallococcus carri]NHN57440.1 nitronate monooxygenase [Metallococcus carri]NOP39164.1 nitronate monooxygenase [Calidifontibacter sp. DB2511S]
MSAVLNGLRRPVIAAPMAGGPSTPELVAAVGDAGGLGFLAAGYRTPEQVEEQIAATRSLSNAPFGVNLFVPTVNSRLRDGEPVELYADRLAPIARRLGAEVGEARWDDTDHFAAKVELLLRARPAMVSFMFGCPPVHVVQRLRAAGIEVMLTVTGADEALAAGRAGADVLCVQGVESGGHRGTHTVDKEPNDRETAELLREVRSVTAMPLVAAGGVGSAEDAALLLRRGATAVQCGTAFLLTPEAGTSAAHRAGLTDSRYAERVVTRAWSGRPATGLRNAFIDAVGADAPAVYPIVDQLTKPLRAAAAQAEDADHVALWAGARWQGISSGSAADVVAHIAP